MSSNKWQKTTLGNVVNILSGGTPSTRVPEYWSNEIKWVTAKDVSESSGYKIYDTDRKISKLGLENSPANIIPKEATVLIARGATMGRCCMLGEDMAINQTCFALAAQEGKIHPYFLFYSIKNLNDYFQKIAHGAIFNTVIGSGLRETEISLPPLPTQRRIADILSTLDEKIELNRQTNATLEAIAQSIFREWFVEFNFPGATGETIDSELGMIPKGWKVGKVKELCNVNKNVITKKDNFDWIDYIEISEVAKGKIGNVSRYKYGEEPSRAKRKLNHGDTVLSTVRPNRGSFFLSINPPNTLIASTGFAVFSPTKAPYSFLYLLLTDPEKLEYYGHVADGAAYPAVNPNLIMDMDIVIPEDGILNRFHSIAEPILNTMTHNEQQSTTLATLRDALLPKLMSGEINI